MNKNIIGPTIHGNGSDGNTLLEGVQNARAALRVAQDKLALAYPNGRDYPQGDAIHKAIAQHNAWQTSLRAVDDDLSNLARAIASTPGFKRRARAIVATDAVPSDRLTEERDAALLLATKERAHRVASEAVADDDGSFGPHSMICRRELDEARDALAAVPKLPSAKGSADAASRVAAVNTQNVERAKAPKQATERRVKLTDRAATLLILVIDNTIRVDGVLKRFWYPASDGRNWSDTLGGAVYASGSGDGASLRCLERHGLIRQEPRLSRYSFSATEDGVLHFERNIRETGRLATLRECIARHARVMSGGAPEEDEP